MKKLIVGWIFLMVLWAGLPGVVQAENWVALSKNVHQAYYDRDSILYPHVKVYDFGLFTMGKTDKDIMRVWTKLYLNDLNIPRILYEIKFSTRVYRVLYAMDQVGNRIPADYSAYKPIPPGSLENDLYETVRPEAKLEENQYPFPDLLLDSDY